MDVEQITEELKLLIRDCKTYDEMIKKISLYIYKYYKRRIKKDG